MFTACLMTIAASTVTLSVVLHPSTDIWSTDMHLSHEQDDEPLMWSDYDDIAALIYALPGWTKDGPTDDEWLPIMRLAHAMQKLSPEDIERVLITYMSKHLDRGEARVEVPHAHTKPLLLLKVMLDLPDDPLTDAERGQLAHDHQISTLANVFAPSVPPGEEWPPFTLSMPVGWNEDGPFLTVGGQRSSGGTGSARRNYQPHLEFRYFLKTYGYRKNLAEFITHPEDTWHRLHLERTHPPDLLKQLDEDTGRDDG